MALGSQGWVFHRRILPQVTVLHPARTAPAEVPGTGLSQPLSEGGRRSGGLLCSLPKQCWLCSANKGCWFSASHGKRAFAHKVRLLFERCCLVRIPLRIHLSSISPSNFNRLGSSYESVCSQLYCKYKIEVNSLSSAGSDIACNISLSQ